MNLFVANYIIRLKLQHDDEAKISTKKYFKHKCEYSTEHKPS